MVKNDIVIIGGSSEIAIEFQKICLNKKLKFIVFTRNIDSIINKNIKIFNYLNDSDEIIKNIKILSNVIIIFFNGALYENRPKKYPSKIEKKNTKLINYEIPINLTKKINNDLQNIDKFVYISSMAAVKFRNKNYIYGRYKKQLENDIKNLDLPSYLIIRFGKVFTKMSDGHKTPPFTLTATEAANSLFSKLNKTGIKYGNIGLFVISIVIKFTPKKIIDFLKI